MGGYQGVENYRSIKVGNQATVIESITCGLKVFNWVGRKTITSNLPNQDNSSINMPWSHTERPQFLLQIYTQLSVWATLLELVYMNSKECEPGYGAVFIYIYMTMTF